MGTKAFGIQDSNVFGFWDWVGGRFSVCSAVGVLPLSLQYGFETVEKFLQGCNSMDEHFRDAPPLQNLPTLMGLLSVWNASCLGYEGCAVLPYCQALVRFVAHIQQLDMESNGKRVTMDGSAVPVSSGAIYFGEPGTNGQHSFYQLLHQGRVVPSELIAHKTFPGDRPSLSLLFPACEPFTLGQLLALYEHRTAVQGWCWGINSFDQWGVELGKALAKDVRSYLSEARQGSANDSKFLQPTQRLLAKYLEK